jgi:hypothetical protein
MNEGLLEGVGSGVAGVRGRFAYTYVVSSQTVNAPPWAKYVSLLAVGGGGGGGSGRYATATNAGAGAGGGGGASRYLYRIPMHLDPHVRTRAWLCTIGAGGSGGGSISVDGTNGNAGTAGGETQFYFSVGLFFNSDTYYTRIGGRITGGNGGNGGSTNAVTGGSGGSANFGQQGMTGGTGNSTAGAASLPTYPTFVGPTLYITQGGTGGCAKNGQNQATQLPPVLFGSTVTQNYNAANYSLNGMDAESISRKWFFFGIDSLVRAPFPFDLWWMSTPGGQGATGADSTTANPGGNGGAGYNGSGGGGGGGTGGTAGTSSGAGGAGGNGYVIFFWEEF